MTCFAEKRGSLLKGNQRGIENDVSWGAGGEELTIPSKIDRSERNSCRSGGAGGGEKGVCIFLVAGKQG